MKKSSLLGSSHDKFFILSRIFQVPFLVIPQKGTLDFSREAHFLAHSPSWYLLPFLFFVRHSFFILLVSLVTPLHAEHRATFIWPLVFYLACRFTHSLCFEIHASFLYPRSFYLAFLFGHRAFLSSLPLFPRIFYILSSSFTFRREAASVLRKLLSISL